MSESDAAAPKEGGLLRSAESHLFEGPGKPEDLNAAVDRVLSRTVDPVSRGLVDAAVRIRDFVRSDTLSWTPHAKTKEEGRHVLGLIEDQSREYLRALAKLVAQDAAGRYDDAVIRSLSVLAEVAEAPPGTTRNISADRDGSSCRVCRGIRIG
jgi:hypothetical protein